MTKQILITGSNGLLGQKLIDLFTERDIPFLATSRGANRNPKCPEKNYTSLDVTKEKEIQRLFESYSFEAVIHTAAMTNVDHCEVNQAECDLLNITATSYLWNACKRHQVHFQLLSTDFIFDGQKGNYSEEDQPSPLNYYGLSKLKAEKLLLGDENKNWSIVRTILVYGMTHNNNRNNLVVWAMTALPKGDKMTIVNDQFRSLTWADDLALGCWLIINKKLNGIFHISGGQTKSIYDWVIFIANHFGWSTEHVTPVSSFELNQIAKRPPRTGFNLAKAREILGFEPKKMEETLDILAKQFSIWRSGGFLT
jgi:dTDP-4-dehydrorhamnose reductase